LAEVGLDVFEGLKVGRVRAASPLAKAGLKEGDTILAVDSVESTSADALRRQLRRAFVIGGAEISIRRGGETLILTASFFGYELPPVPK
jgi:S1-C subfamily serine protease